MSRSEAPAPRRPTLVDVARRAGVSKGAASLAMNGRPGVSETTRQRVLAVAQELGWTANSAARALSVSRSDVIGLVLARPARLLWLEPFYMAFISGIEAVLAETEISLLLKMVDDPDPEAEIAVYRKWWIGRRVDGVILTDVRLHDQRLAVLSGLGLPTVVLGSDPDFDGAATISTVWADNDAMIGTAVRYLAGLGHRRLARVAGPAGLSHCSSRTASFLAIAEQLGLPAPQVVSANFSGEDGARATRQLLLGPGRPTAIMYENDVMAVAAVGAARELGIEVPTDVSILAWDDSPLCGLIHPTVTAMQRDVPAMGRQVARLLLDTIGGSERTARLQTPGVLVPRGSTAPPPS